MLTMCRGRCHKTSTVGVEMKRIEFSWTHEGRRENGDPVDVSELTYRLYEFNSLIVDNIGELNFSLLMDDKDHGMYEYSVTAVDEMGLESEKSNSVTVVFIPPAAPTSFTALYVAS